MSKHSIDLLLALWLSVCLVVANDSLAVAVWPTKSNASDQNTAESWSTSLSGSSTANGVQRCFFGWTPFREHCYQVASDWLMSHSHGQTACEEKSSALVEVPSAAYAFFLKKWLAEHNKTLDGVWTGATRNKTTGQLVWNKHRLVDLDVLSPGHVQPTVRLACLQATFDQDNQMVWSMADCDKKNLVVCQKLQQFDREDTVEYLTNFRLMLDSVLDRLSAIASQQPLPDGFIYTQLPGQNSPDKLWPWFVWSDVSKEYAGLFFRVLGGDSASFGDTQKECDKHLDSIRVRRGDETKEWEVVGGNGEWHQEVAVPVPVNDFFDEIHFSQKISKCEVRPKNTAVRIWKKIG